MSAAERDFACEKFQGDRQATPLHFAAARAADLTASAPVSELAFA
jgi:hypothetical protein